MAVVKANGIGKDGLIVQEEGWTMLTEKGLQSEK